VERIGRYEIRRELGRGSMSIVYEGFDSRIDRSLGIKILREHFARDVSSRQRFLREARAAGGLSHPNITTVFDVGQHDGLPFLAMERLTGDTLAARLDQAAEFDVEEVLGIGLQLARGLDYAHRHGVIHRDLKPANIHLDADTDLVKIMDFGIAAIERSGRSSGVSELAGTPTHMAPEQLTDGNADERSDLYSLGVVLFELLSGELPFDAEDPEGVIDQVIRHQTRPLTPRNPTTPRELVDLVYRLMAREPDSRPGSARQVAEELEEIRSGMQRGLVRAVRQRSSVLRWPLGVGALVGVVLVLGLWHVYRSQTGAIEAATYGFGDALASLVAQETAEALILEDNTALSVLVSDFLGQSPGRPPARRGYFRRHPGIDQSVSPGAAHAGARRPVGAARHRQRGDEPERRRICSSSRCRSDSRRVESARCGSAWTAANCRRPPRPRSDCSRWFSERRCWSLPWAWDG
jgi:hypothetical protein